MTARLGPRSRAWRLRTALVAALLVLLVAIGLGGRGAGARRLMAAGYPPPASVSGPTVPAATAPASPAALPATSTTLPTDGCGLSRAERDGPQPVGRCTVVEIGDSLGSDLGWGLDRLVAPSSGLRLVLLDRPDTGLSNPWYYDWPAHLAAAVSQYRPQLVLICLGGNDEQGMEVGGSAVQFPTPAWKAEYQGRIRQLLAGAGAGGAYVLWVGLPPMQQPSYSSGIATLDGLYAQAVASTPDAAFVSSWSLFSDPAAAFGDRASVNGQPVELRAPDGIHLSLAGEDVIATYVLDQMAVLFHVQLAPTDPATITAWR